MRWNKLFFYPLDLALVSAQILQWKMCTKKFILYKFMENVAKGLIAEVARKLTEQLRKCFVGRLVGSGHFVHGIPAVGTKGKGKCHHICKVCGDKAKCHKGKRTWKYTTICCQKCNVGLVSSTAMRFST
jgi:hypothetical protein